MSDETKNCCPPETTAPKMEVHDAAEGSKDIKPKMISTAHKQLSQDEFQRKVAMAARVAVAEDMEKEALGGVLRSGLMLGRAALKGGLPRFGQAVSTLASRAGTNGKTWSNLLPRALNAAGNSKVLSPLTAGAGQAKSWLNLPTRMMFGEKGLGSAAILPFTHAGHGALTAAPLVAGAGAAAMPYIGGALQRVGGALRGTVGGSGGTPGLGGAMGAGLLGAGLGGVAGALMPGEEEYEDENGNVRKRSRGMLAGALRGAGMGGLAGGAVGAGMDAYNSGAFKFGSAVAKLEKQAGPPSQMFGNQQSRGTTQNMFSAMAPSAPQPQSRGVITKAPSTMQNMSTLAGRFGAGIAAGLGGPARAGLAAGAGAAKGLTSAAGLGSAAGGMLGGKLFAR